MTYLTIPTPTRALADTVAAEMSTVRQALKTTWATPAALERAEQAAERMLDQIKALRIEMKRIAKGDCTMSRSDTIASFAVNSWINGGRVIWPEADLRGANLYGADLCESRITLGNRTFRLTTEDAR